LIKPDIGRKQRGRIDKALLYFILQTLLLCQICLRFGSLGAADLRIDAFKIADELGELPDVGDDLPNRNCARSTASAALMNISQLTSPEQTTARDFVHLPINVEALINQIENGPVVDGPRKLARRHEMQKPENDQEGG
jgi:hypothetical protein